MTTTTVVGSDSTSPMRITTLTTEPWYKRCIGWLCPIAGWPLQTERKSTASVSVDNINPLEESDMKNRNSNTVIDTTINIFRDYMRGQAEIANGSDSTTDIKRAFSNARSCRMVAREAGFLPKFDRAVAADKRLRCFTSNDYNFGKYADAEGAVAGSNGSYIF
jgi:hypothetical protein